MSTDGVAGQATDAEVSRIETLAVEDRAAPYVAVADALQRRLEDRA